MKNKQENKAKQPQKSEKKAVFRQMSSQSKPKCSCFTCLAITYISVFLRVISQPHFVFKKFFNAKIYSVFAKKRKRLHLKSLYCQKTFTGKIAIENRRYKCCFSLLFYWKMLFTPKQAPFLTTFWIVNYTLKHS
jgi:hypothetical protein